MKALYAGSFDPFTIGHLWIAKQAAELFGELIVAVGYNESKRNEMAVEERLAQIREVFRGHSNIEVCSYTGLTVEFAKTADAGVIVRGIRNSIDYEKERELANINIQISGIPTVFIPTLPALEFISSSMVRELRHFGYDTTDYVATCYDSDINYLLRK